jgi:hypothetical protein
MDKSGEVQGYQVSVKQRSGTTIQDSSDAKTAAVMQNCVCQKKFWHIIFTTIGILKSNIH